MKYIGLQNDLIAFVTDTREELESLPCVELTEIKEVEFAESYNGVIYIDPAELQTAKETAVRAVRNKYLVEYVDGVVSNPLRWADMSAEEQTQITDYRRYLLDYTTTENWYEQNPLTFDEWKLTEQIQTENPYIDSVD
jgi:hypothetical protein